MDFLSEAAEEARRFAPRLAALLDHLARVLHAGVAKDVVEQSRVVRVPCPPPRVCVQAGHSACLGLLWWVGRQALAGMEVERRRYLAASLLAREIQAECRDVLSGSVLEPVLTASPHRV